MDQNTSAPELKKVTLCEALGCFQNAAEEVKVKVGTLGWIKLTLCCKCKGKFVSNSRETSEASKD